MTQKDPPPSAWDPAGRTPALRYLQVTGTRVKYVGPGNDDRDAASVRANYPVPSDCPVYYYEIDIVNKGRDGFIGIGFAVRDVKLDRLPGWEPHSYGYHGDDGHAFSGRGTGRPFGPCFGTGDWVGVIWNRVEGTVRYSKRGFDLGVAFEGVTEDALYPIVGFRTPDEEIDANFGTDLVRRPFKGDVDSIRREAMQQLHDKILHTQLPASQVASPQDLLLCVGRTTRLCPPASCPPPPGSAQQPLHPPLHPLGPSCPPPHSTFPCARYGPLRPL